MIFMTTLLSRLRKSRRVAMIAAAVVITAGGTWLLPHGILPVMARPADTLRVGVIALPPGRGNPYKGVGGPHIYVWSALFDGLTFVDETGAATPALATSWQNIDPNTWRFNLRRGIKFQNGESFDANAVRVTMDYATSDEGLATAAGRNFKGYSLKIIDDFTSSCAA